jgi:hypothetical protein
LLACPAPQGCAMTRILMPWDASSLPMITMPELGWSKWASAVTCRMLQAMSCKAAAST